MKRQVWRVPVLPGYGSSAEKTEGQNFRKSQHFGKHRNVCMLSEVARPNPNGTLVVGEGQVPPGPRNHWLCFDKQVLRFEADCIEGDGKKRDCILYYFLEDDTIQVVEPKVVNSGCYQGVLIYRHRVPQPAKWDQNRECAATINSMAAHGSGYYSVAHLNIGEILQIYGRRFLLRACDTFTRLLLQKLGATVSKDTPNPRQAPQEPKPPSAPVFRTSDERQFLKLDGLVLNFKGYWDDRSHEGGLLHKLTVLYYLADDTMEIRFDEGGRMVKRQRLALETVSVGHGAPDQTPILNVMKGERFLRDSSPATGAFKKLNYIRDSELAIGSQIRVYGRTVVLISCDPFTQKYYNDRYGIEHFEPLSYPWDETREPSKYPPRVHLPPYNGFGSYEDSATNCTSFIIKERQKDLSQFLTKDRQGMNSHVLRFSAKFKEGCEIRNFVISYFLSDDTIKIHEAFTPNTGYRAGDFLKRGFLLKPNQDLMNVDSAPLKYTAEDFYIGALVHANDFVFVLTDADDYALSYMEQNSGEFPKSNSKLILDKMRPHLGVRYKDLVAAMMDEDTYGGGFVAAKHFKNITKSLMPEDSLTEHEYVTLLRRYSVSENQPPDHALRSKVHSWLRRQLFKDIDLLKIELVERDRNRSGFLAKNEAWSACRCLPVPIPIDMLSAVFEKIKMNSQGEIDYDDLIWYLDCENQPANLEIQNEGAVGFMFARPIKKSTNEISYKSFLEELGLEDTMEIQ